ncbi:biotin--[acetyl-CoA-carboxylase] ligase [Oxalobacteraceae bacterium R-40]|uniref:biotin--[biotin carboxyl-carrier protein] ligase n=1 Tax=Keguizhuia sedimenti TaxID=3064264 RepID=A0ABU1BJI2_9BURK|nr:biotin--[acetyl-CoA-carboxylase] ligase [Oxalobacteraceae bacterium R-40]
MSFVYSEQDIAGACEGLARQVAIEVVRETGSTNADLMARLHALRGPVLLIAEKQTAGRGRAGRTWHMEPGKTLTFSLAWKFALPLAQLPGLSLVAGVSLAETLAAWGIDARLKWPNDVLKDGGKLAGILIEAAPEKDNPSHAAWAVIGIGLNLDASPALQAQIGAPIAAADSLPENRSFDRNRIVAALLNSLAKALVQFEDEGLSPFIERWNCLHAYAGKPVAILDHGNVLHRGRALGIDHAGRFLLDTDEGQVAVMSGDVSLRLAEHA